MRVVLISGASRGLGREVAIRFGDLKDRVVVNFKQDELSALRVVEEINRAGGEALSYQADVANLLEVKAMVDCIIQKWHRIDLLINNAGIINDALLVRMTELAWSEVIETNLKGVFNCIKVVSETMIAQRQGQIINISSLSGLRGRKGQSNYAASKAAIIGLSRSVAKELGQYNIGVNVVVPGYLLTDMGKTAPKEVIDEARRGSVFLQFSQTEEVASFVTYLADLKNVSGQVFNLDSRIY